MKTLSRPMFKRGGGVSAKNNGIVSGFENGGRVELQLGGGSDIRRQLLQFGSPENQAAEYATDPNIQALMDQYVQDPVRQKGLSTSDWLRIASAGADIMGAQPTSDRGGFIGALQAASPSLGGLGKDLATSAAAKEAAYQAKLDAANRARLGIQLSDIQSFKADAATKEAAALKYKQENQRFQDTIAYETEMANNAATALAKEGRLDRASAELIATEKRDQPFEFEAKLDAYNEAYANKLLYQNQLKDLDSNDPKYQDINDRLQKAIGTISMLQKGSIASSILISTVENSLTKETVERWQSVALTIAEQGVANNKYALGSEEYYAAIKSVYDQMVSTWMSGITDAVISVDFSGVGLAQGGRVGLQNGGDPMMEQMAGPAATQTVPMNEPKQAAQLTFEELRARLPQEVTDKVIRLLVQSEEALLDFTRIQVPEDINKFNQKYGTDLTLPTQVA